MVRASLALVQGQFAEAWRLHPLVFVFLPAACAEFLWLAVPRLPRWRYPRWLLGLLAAALLGTWVLR